MFSEKKNQTPVRGQDGKISDTQGKDFYWSPTRLSAGKISDTQGKDFYWSPTRLSLETNRDLSLGCLRFFRLALLPVLDPLFLFKNKCRYQLIIYCFKFQLISILKCKFQPLEEISILNKAAIFKGKVLDTVVKQDYLHR